MPMRVDRPVGLSLAARRRVEPCAHDSDSETNLAPDPHVSAASSRSGLTPHRHLELGEGCRPMVAWLRERLDA